MKLKKFEIDKFEKLPDIHGALYDAIEEFKPRSYQKLENDIKSFLDYINPENIEKNPPISVCMLIAPWGLGKTTTYDVIIQNLLTRQNLKGYSVKLRAQEISNYYDTFKNENNFKLFARNADRYLYLISKLLLYDNSLHSILPKELKNLEGEELVSKTLEVLQNQFKFCIIFIDELEEVINNKNNIISFILKSTKDLLNGSSIFINTESNRNFLSFILSCTDAAFYEISRLIELKYQIGGITRRIPEIYIESLSLEECIEYLLKLNKFCYNGKFIESFVNPAASFHAIARMAMRNPGYMKTIFTSLMNKSASLHSSSSLIYQIDGDFILKNLKNYKLEYMETQRNAIIPEIYSNWLKKFENDPIILGLISLFICELKPFTLQEIIERFDEKISDNLLLTKISIFNEYINTIHSNVQDAIIQINPFKNDFTIVDLLNIIKDCGFEIEVLEDFKNYINFKIDGLIVVEDFLENLCYFEIDKNERIKTKLFFTTDVEVLRQQLFPYLSNNTINILKNKFKKYLDINCDLYILNPMLYNLIFPLPIPKEFNILNDKNENVRLWTEISVKKKSEIYKTSICKIISNFLISNDLIKKSISRKEKSSILTIDDVPFFKNNQDKNQFLILENYNNDELSNNPLNIMIWREIGDYNNSIMNDISRKIEDFQKNTKRNLHILFLISQNKIQEDIITNLNETLDFTIVKEILLSQFDITKFAFLNEIIEKYEGNYDEVKFENASKQLINQFNEIFTSIKEDINKKGLNITLKIYPSKLYEVPQLMKHILYDFEGDFSDWGKIKIEKPFKRINPTGLTVPYSSSLDDWSNERLKNDISRILSLNEFIRFENGGLMVSMPKIERTILKLIRQFDRFNINFKLKEIESFFFDKSGHDELFREVFITDLENRGLIEYNSSTKFIKLVQIDEELLKNKFNDLKLKIKNFKVKDKRFYHIFTMKQNGYSLIYLEDFLNILENLKNLNKCNNFNEFFKNTKYIVFLRIYEVFNNIIDRIFVPLEISLSKLNEEINNLGLEQPNFDYIEHKLNEYGLESIDIKNLSEIQNLTQQLMDLKNIIYGAVDKDKLEDEVKFYYKINKGNVKVAGEPFSYQRLKENKLKEDFKEPYLNFIYWKFKEDLKKYQENDIIEQINYISELINKIEVNYRNIESHITKIVIKDENSLAFNIIKKVEHLSKFDFVKKKIKINNLNDIIKFLEELNTEINNIIIPVKIILGRSLYKESKSLTEKIFSIENKIKQHQFEIEEYINFCIEKKVYKDKNELLKIQNQKEKYDNSFYINRIQNCSNLNELADEVSQIERELSFKFSNEKTKLLKINDIVFNYFNDFKDFDSLIPMFESLKMNAYAKQCASYLRNLENFKQKYENYKSIINTLLSLKARIEEGHNKFLKEELTEITLNLYKTLYEDFKEIGYFTEKELIKIAENLHISETQLKEAIKELQNKNLIENKYYFI
ncbi:MAG: hypothetical protein ACTSRH_05205 [Promethearchaeota archaeon]